MSSSSIDEPTSIASRRGAAVTMPMSIAPMLAREAPEPFDSRDHIFELMWGGVRAIAFVRDSAVRLAGSNGINMTAHFPELAGIADRLNCYEAILDGEIVAVDAQGHPHFDALRPRLLAMALPEGEPPIEFARPRSVAGQISYQAFDLLWLNRHAQTSKALWQRKNKLHDIVRPSPEFAAVDFVDDEGIAFFDAVLERKLEGIVARRKFSEYTPGVRSRDWLEVRAQESGEFVVGGYTFGGTRRKGEPFDQLLLGAYSDGALEYVGAVSGGLTDAEARQVVSVLEPHVVDAPAFADPPPVARLVYWTAPRIVCRVRFSEWSRDGHLRFPIFSALRPDIEAASCVTD